MKAIDRPFTRIVNGTTQFVIPVFQRDYTWTEPQCAQLWSDVIHAARSGGGRRHFLGSIVYVATGDNTAGFKVGRSLPGGRRQPGPQLPPPNRNPGCLRSATSLRRPLLSTRWLHGRDPRDRCPDRCLTKQLAPPQDLPSAGAIRDLVVLRRDPNQLLQRPPNQ